MYLVTHHRFFPSHYGPYVSDVKGFQDVVPNFLHERQGEPFLPFQQVPPSYTVYPNVRSDMSGSKTQDLSACSHAQKTAMGSVH